MKTRRPGMPTAYGLQPVHGENGLLPWTWAVEHLLGARNYWLVSVGKRGLPHAVPVWGIWMESELLFSTGKSSRKALNLLRQPACIVHLESGDEVVILEGTAESLLDQGRLAGFVEQYEQKYRIRPEIDDVETLTFCFQPSKGMGWREADFPSSATCWDFD